MSANPEWQAVTNKQTLKSLAKKGHFIFPPKFGGGCQIDEGNQPMRFKEYSHAYNMDIEYEVRYIDGSFYPFLFMRQPKYGATTQYGYYY